MLGPFQAFCWKDWARFDTCASAKFHFHFDHCRAGSTSYGECFCTNRPFSQVHKDDSNMTFPWFSKKMTTKNVLPLCRAWTVKNEKEPSIFLKIQSKHRQVISSKLPKSFSGAGDLVVFCEFFFVIFRVFFSNFAKVIKNHKVTSTRKTLRKLARNHLTVFWSNFEKSKGPFFFRSVIDIFTLSQCRLYFNWPYLY